MSKKTLKVLIVDDSPEDIELYKRLLNKIYECTILESYLAQDGLNIIKTEEIDILYLDYSLPDMDGIQFIEHIKKHNYNHFPIVVLTGQGNEEIATQFLKIGASDYITKSKLSAESIQRITNNAINQFNYQKILKEKNLALYNFADIISHDLKSPIARVYAYAKLLNKTNTNSNIDNYINNIFQDARYCLDFINTLYQYAKIGRSTIKLTTVDLNEVVRQAISNLELDIKNKSVQLNISELPSVKGNRIWLIQLFQNIIANSLKFSLDDQVVISINSVDLGSEYIQMDIIDNGIGIRESKVDKVFNPFYRVDNSEEYEGFGLGLTLCKMILDQHYGKITLESKINCGTKASVTLLLATYSDQQLAG